MRSCGRTNDLPPAGAAARSRLGRGVARHAFERSRDPSEKVSFHCIVSQSNLPWPALRFAGGGTTCVVVRRSSRARISLAGLP